MAGVSEPDCIDAEVANFAVLDRHVPGGVGHDRGLDLRGGLHRLETARRCEPLAVLEGQPAKNDVLDELARGGIAFEHQELLRHGGHDRGLGHVLARGTRYSGSRHVVQPTVAGQEPFAGRIQGAQIVLQDVMGIEPPRIPRFHRLAASRQEAMFRVDRIEEPPRIVPVVIDHQVDVAKVLRPIVFKRLLGVFRPHADGLLGLAPPSFCGRIEARLVQILHVEEELIGRARPRGAVAVDEQLLEIPAARGHFRKMRFPDALVGGLPAGDRPSAAEQRMRPAAA